LPKLYDAFEDIQAHVIDFNRIGATFKIDMMPWSSQLDRDCDHLATTRETESDSVLAIVARISRICLQASEVYRHLAESPSKNVQVVLHIEPLIASLAQVKKTLSEAQLSHGEFASYR
jgi:hypothetical protein